MNGVSEQRSPPGLIASARGLAGTSLALLGNRLALLGVEVSEEGARLLAVMLYGGLSVLALGAGTIFLAVFVTVALWDNNRLLALGMFATLFLGAGAVTALLARALLQRGSSLFAASLAELQRDRAALGAGGGTDAGDGAR